LVDYAADLLKLAQETHLAVAETAEIVSGKLVVGALETLCVSRLPKLLAEFHRRYPIVELDLKSADSGTLRSGVKSGNLDVAFLFGDAVASADVRAEVVAHDDLFLIVPAGHRLATCLKIAPESLVGEAFLVTPPGCIYRQMFDEALAASLPERPKIVGEFASLGTIRELVAASLGCALVPQSALGSRPDHVVSIPWSGEHRTTPVTMTWRARHARPSAAAAFLAIASEYMAD
jgi:DNA-binding transcriptional LysR family regulator